MRTRRFVEPSRKRAGLAGLDGKRHELGNAQGFSLYRSILL